MPNARVVHPLHHRCLCWQLLTSSINCQPNQRQPHETLHVEIRAWVPDDTSLQRVTWQRHEDEVNLGNYSMIRRRNEFLARSTSFLSYCFDIFLTFNIAWKHLATQRQAAVPSACCNTHPTRLCEFVSTVASKDNISSHMQ